MRMLFKLLLLVLAGMLGALFALIGEKNVDVDSMDMMLKIFVMVFLIAVCVKMAQKVRED